MKELLLALALAHAADATTTVINLRAGLAESNPLMPSHPVAFVAVKGALAAAQIETFHLIARDHPRLGKGLAWTALSLEWTVVGWNLRARIEWGALQ